MHKFFVSHSSKDRIFVETELIPLLEQWGIEPWYSRNDIQGSQSFHRAIIGGLRSSMGVIVVLSPNATASRWVRNEIIWSFTERTGRLVSVLLADCERNSLDDLHLEFRELQHVDFRQGAEAPIDRLKAAIDEVVDNFASVSTGGCGDGGIETVKPDLPTKQKYRFANLKPAYTPEIESERRLLIQKWKEISDAYLKDHDIFQLHKERIKTIDHLVENVANKVTLQMGRDGGGELAIVARGGYGNEILSSGSDLDVSVIHEDGDRQWAEKFAKMFFPELRDIWEAAPFMDISAFSINTVDELQKQWAAVPASRESRKLSPLISFDHTRLLSGSESQRDSLTERWNEFVRKLPDSEFELVLEELRYRLEQSTPEHSFVAFDIKADAGGILETTITQFCYRWLSAVGRSVEEVDTERLLANRFKLLRIRECLVAGIRTTGHNVYREDLEWLLLHPFQPFEAEIKSADAALNDIARMRREVRIDLTRAIAQLSHCR